MTLHPAVFAASLVLSLAATGSGDPDLGLGDYELIIEISPTMNVTACAKSERMCLQAIESVRMHRWTEFDPSVPMRCTAHPGCFSPESNTIKGFNDH
jgi:hypothetical protein